MKQYTILIAMLLTGCMASAQNSSVVKTGAQRIKYSPMLFGQFIEHFDNQIYGGIYCPGNPLSDEDGFRTDVIKAMKELKVPLVRWPGGCFASTYHWQDGVGPNRHPEFDKTWGVEEPNTFGTDEFIKWCRKVGCEPYIVTNAGTGPIEGMSDWVEYCNLNIGENGRQRIANGYPEPHNVRYWCIGNETLAPWEMGTKTAQEWGPLVREASKMMLVVDKNLKLGAAVITDREAMLTLLKNAGKYLDFIAFHCGWDGTGATFDQIMMKTGLPEEHISQVISILEEGGYGGGKMKLSIDEWQLRGWIHPGIGDPRKGFDFEARRQNDIASTYTLADAIYAACFLNASLRHSDIVDITCFSTIVNTRGALFVYPEGLVKRVIYHALWMYSNLLLPYVVPTTETLDLLTRDGQKTGVLDVILTSDEEGKRFVCAVANKDQNSEQPLRLDFQGMGKKTPRKVQATILSGKSADDYNDIGQQRVKPFTQPLPVKDGIVNIPPHSLTVIEIE
ncbi:MAG: hypothetical protein IJR87_05145 [Bacteroidaceae bacterium]|nr:hypothetical protein [Bacteroidaceae bacterium]